MTKSLSEDLEFLFDFSDNLNELGKFLNYEASKFGLESFQEFLAKKQKIITPPKKPNRLLANTGNTLKQQVFNEVNRQAMMRYYKKLYTYEQQIGQQKILQKYEPTKSGYAQYLTENFEILSPFLDRTNKIPISQYNRHTYITGGSGSGKSELIKVLIWHYLTRNKSTGLILLTPNGDIAYQVAKFWVNLENDRLIYIEPNLDGFFPCLNPFDVADKEFLSDSQAENYAFAFLAVFQELLGREFSDQMRALLINTLPVLIKMPNSSVYDLVDFLEPKQDKEHNPKIFKYIDFANKNIQNAEILKFLNGQFLIDDSYNRTKSAIHTRLRVLFNSTVMQAIMKGRSTLNIEQAIEQRKLLVFNFAKGKVPIDYRVLGLFVIATIKIISFRRDGKENLVPCHLFIDEMQNYITPSLQEILEESRKFKLFLTLAQQQAGARMKEELFRSILGNTAIKFTGKNETETLSILAKETGETVKNLQETLKDEKKRLFSLWRGYTSEPPIFLKIPSTTADNTQSMTKKQWEAIKSAQIKAFYRPMGQSIQEEPTTQEAPKNTQILDEFNTYFN